MTYLCQVFHGNQISWLLLGCGTEQGVLHLRQVVLGIAEHHDAKTTSEDKTLVTDAPATALGTILCINSIGHYIVYQQHWDYNSVFYVIAALLRRVV